MLYQQKFHTSYSGQLLAFTKFKENKDVWVTRLQSKYEFSFLNNTHTWDYNVFAPRLLCSTAVFCRRLGSADGMTQSNILYYVLLYEATSTKVLCTLTCYGREKERQTKNVLDSAEWIEYYAFTNKLKHLVQ